VVGEAGAVSRWMMPFLRQILSNRTSPPLPKRSVNCLPLSCQDLLGHPERGMTMQETRIVLRTGGEADPIVDHPGQPADYVHTDGTVWTWHQRWRLVSGIRHGERMVGRHHLRAYILVTPRTKE